MSDHYVSTFKTGIPWTYFSTLVIICTLALFTIKVHRQMLLQLSAAESQSFEGHWEGAWNAEVKFHIKFSVNHFDNTAMVEYHVFAYPKYNVPEGRYKSEAQLVNNRIEFSEDSLRTQYFFEQGQLKGLMFGRFNSTSTLVRISESDSIIGGDNE